MLVTLGHMNSIRAACVAVGHIEQFMCIALWHLKHFVLMSLGHMDSIWAHSQLNGILCWQGDFRAPRAVGVCAFRALRAVGVGAFRALKAVCVGSIRALWAVGVGD